MIDATGVSPLDVSNVDSVVIGLEARADLWSGADVIGVGSSARTVRELHVVAHGLVRLLVDRFGFRSVLVEGDREASEALDAFVREGIGDPRSTLAGTRPFLATEELLDLVLWLRRHNQRDRTRLVRIVHGGIDDLSSPAALERSLADQVISWHQRFGDRIVYLGGVAHTATAERVIALAPHERASLRASESSTRRASLRASESSTRRASESSTRRRRLTGAPAHRPWMSSSALRWCTNEPVRSAGQLLREHFGSRYRSVGFTFGSGAIPQPVPPPAPTSLEARLDELPYATVLLANQDPVEVEGLAAADRVRLVGPGYDPRDDPNHSMVGTPTAWFDVIVHHKIATSVTFLEDSPW